MVSIIISIQNPSFFSIERPRARRLSPSSTHFNQQPFRRSIRAGVQSKRSPSSTQFIRSDVPSSTPSSAARPAQASHQFASVRSLHPDVPSRRSPSQASIQKESIQAFSQAPNRSPFPVLLVTLPILLSHVPIEPPPHIKDR